MKIELISSSQAKSTDLLLVGAFDNEKTFRSLSGTGSAQATVKAAVSKNRFGGKSGETLFVYNPAVKTASEVGVLGLGARSKFDSSALRGLAARAVQLAQSHNAKKVRFVLDTFVGGKVKAAEAAQILTELTYLATYKFDKYKGGQKSKGKKSSGLSLVEILASGAQKTLKKQVQVAAILAQGTVDARNLLNEPGNISNPATLAQAAKRLAQQKKFRCKVIHETELKRMKMGGIIGVCQGSKTPPHFIIMEHGASHKRKGTVCLVGKGVTFDTGGISIKPSASMEEMKYDKGGACTVIATMGVVASLKLPLHVVGLVPAVENMPGKDAQRPGDIIRMYSGKTVEVLNTDAEGRLILADALAYSARYKPKAIIDLATLTGMCVYTFGDKCSGLMGNNQKLMDKIIAAGEEAGERCWQLPMWDEYGEQIRGHHSDLLNIGGRYGGTITAGKFLEAFVPEKTPWAHLDIAGTAWVTGNKPDCPKGATGVAVRLLAKLLSNWR